MTLPHATYRVQLHKGFGFDDVAALASYFAHLGISHVYLSPILEAAPGSMHGYDVINHRRINEELGGERAYERMCEALTLYGLSHVVDIVPNHMSVAAGRRNAWWWDVLENGQSSRWANSFDIDWRSTDERYRQNVLLPVLGDHYGRVLEAGELELHREGGAFVVKYYEHEAPISPRTLDVLLAAAAERCDSPELASIAVALGRLPPADATDMSSVEERHRDKEVLRSRLERLIHEEPAVREAVDAEIAATNADFDALDALLQRQNYRLAFWRVAGQELDYRRFFDIPQLIALHMDDPRVFDEAHELILHLVTAGHIQGLRVDHPDGLRDPKRYFDRLRAGAGADTWVVAEKILAPGEPLPSSWAVQGTTGYDFLNDLTRLFVDPSTEAAMTEVYAAFTGEEVDFEQVAFRAKHLIMDETLATDLYRLTAIALSVCERHRRYSDYTRRDLLIALREIAANFDVYRTYVVAGEEPSAEDVAAVERAVEKTRRSRPDLDPELLDFFGQVLLGRVEGEPEADLAFRFQQFTAPVMAKGVEDTAFYRHVRLTALNEVGGEPGVFGAPPGAFHAANARRAERWPSTLLATSTHDTKRSEDVRARLVLLSEIPDAWGGALQRWADHNDRHRRSEMGWPDRNVEYLLYQTLVGAWPIDPDRATAYMEKAIKEAKRQTSWISPDAEYEEAVRRFTLDVLSDEEFVSELVEFATPIVEAGRVVALAQALLKVASPGVPDLYQGTELWDLSLVDPDNRRPVDFDARRELLDKVKAATAADVLRWADAGAPKLWLLHHALRVRRRCAGAFGPGSSYRPLTASGAKAEHAVAFVRGDDGEGVVIAVVPRLVLGLGGDWGDTALALPSGRWVDALGGDRAWDGGAAAPVPLAELLADFPVALLTRL